MTMNWWESAQNWISDKRTFTGLTGGTFADQTDALMERGGQYISFTHVPTGVEVRFKAFLKSFNDSYKPNWQSSKGYGRMDAIQTYDGTTRSIQIAFDVPAASIKEAKSNLQKVSRFAQMMYPVFDGSLGAQTIKSPPFIRMRFMNWAQNHNLDGLLGTLSGFSFAPNMDSGVFQTAANKEEKKYTMYPKMFTISTTLTVIHENRLGWEKTIVEGNKRAKVGLKTTTFYQKENELFKPQTPTFPYGETTAASQIVATSEKQITDEKTNKELMKSNQNKITETRQSLSKNTSISFNIK